MVFNLSITKYLKQVVLLILTTGCFFTLQGFTIKKEDVKIKDCALTWVGSKVTGSHEGTITLKSGYLI